MRARASLRVVRVRVSERTTRRPASRPGVEKKDAESERAEEAEREEGRQHQSPPLVSLARSLAPSLFRPGQ